MPEARARPGIGEALTGLGGVALLLSLFLPWSRQLTPQLAAAVGHAPALLGVVANPTAWQVYTSADVVLALLAAALMALGARPAAGPALRWSATAAAVLAMAFVAHALVVAPTRGVLFAHQVHGRAGAVSGTRYLPHTATRGSGEVLALGALAVALLGLGTSALAPAEGRGPRS